MQPGNLGVPFRLPLLILGFISLASGVLAGLARLGWSTPPPSAQLALLHGPLMVSGFLGTVIGLERAVAMGRRWAYAGPLLTGLGGMAILLGISPSAGAAFITLGSAVLLSGTVQIMLRQRELFMVTMALGAASWLAGNLIWQAGTPVSGVVTLWMNFLILTIAGERLELSAEGVLEAFRLSQRVDFTRIVADVERPGRRCMACSTGCASVWPRTIRSMPRRCSAPVRWRRCFWICTTM